MGLQVNLGGYWCTFLEVVKSPEMCVLTLHQAMDLVIKKRTLHLHLMRYCCSLISTSPWSGNEGNFIANSNFLITKAFIQTHFICSFVLTKKTTVLESMRALSFLSLILYQLHTVNNEYLITII